MLYYVLKQCDSMHLQLIVSFLIIESEATVGYDILAVCLSVDLLTVASRL